MDGKHVTAEKTAIRIETDRYILIFKYKNSHPSNGISEHTLESSITSPGQSLGELAKS